MIFSAWFHQERSSDRKGFPAVKTSYLPAGLRPLMTALLTHTSPREDKPTRLVYNHSKSNSSDECMTNLSKPARRICT